MSDRDEVYHEEMQKAFKMVMIRLFSLFPSSLFRCLKIFLHIIMQFNVVA
jgi:hypothetical protein